jgi:hypothetical protein
VLILKIEGYFRTLKRANDTAEKLKKAGYNAYVDGNDHYTGSEGAGTNMPGTSEGGSLSGLVLNSGDSAYDDSSKAPLLASSPMVSGMGGFSEIADLNCKVVVDSDKDEEKIKEIITGMEGELQSYNINVRKGVKDINVDKLLYDNLLKNSK